MHAPDRPPVVTHVVRQFHPAIGGFEDVVLNLARMQRSRWKIDARVVTLDRLFTEPGVTLPAIDMVDDIPVRRIPWHGSSRYPVAPSVLRAIAGSDLVHVHAIDFFFDFLAMTKPLHRKQLVASTHGGFFHTPKWGRLKQIWFQTLTRASAAQYASIIAVSEADAQTFKSVAGDKLVLLENGVDLAKFACRPGRDRRRRRIVTFGRMTRHKRLDRLVALVVALLQREPGWELVIAGPPGDHPIDEIVAPAVRAGVAASIHIRGALSTAVLADEIAVASWFGSASAFEGFGLAAVEAAGAGLIPVLSDIPPFAKLHAVLKVGLLFDPARPDETAARMIDQVSRSANEQPDIQARLAAGVAHYGIDAVVADHVALYRKLLGHEAS